MRSPSTSTVGDYGRLMGRFWLVVLIAVCAGGAAGFAASTLQSPHYESESRVLITVPGPPSVTAGFVGDLAGRLRAESYRNLATTDQVLRRVIAADREHVLGDDLTVADLLERITVTTFTDSAVLAIHTQGDTADAAVTLATAVAVQMRQVVVEVESTLVGTEKFELQIVDPAQPAVEVPETSAVTAVGLGAGMGFLIAAIILIGLDAVRDRISDKNDVHHTLRDLGTAGGTP
ncbi:protein tyrosine kinase [Williamsia sp.]|uniref:protein tyrosine kinase n=1 Tax=Williamsia sp. TaxID=1872085 RepID=UPI001A194088|nr:protein tyrosine kinase [Williamsia sp.]MBJ7289146.1 protein tyrosine kinase [Williamsia sp.]